MTTVADRVNAEKDLARQLEQHAGRWVAVRGHEIVAVADTPKELHGKVESETVERIFRVPEAEGSTLL